MDRFDQIADLSSFLFDSDIEGTPANTLSQSFLEVPRSLASSASITEHPISLPVDQERDETAILQGGYCVIA
ncbi:hypothetical protein PQX77_011844 [Marasmius sp. AFHP31]|nr:hypothetical protein PQX77_011844 [Marasmius sp. AFHP31]